ncbi:phenylalanine--tRNA ligase subunit beta [Candidatus Pacearchaeota archaeon]|nr:phenylalanine--tRNA ligase subunit beta [Candidatus Pacearchaeota archaeon]
MTILTLNKKELEKKIGKIDDKVRERVDMFGTPIDGENEDELMIEVFPNRPDLLSLQGFSRAFNSFLGKGEIKEYKVEGSGEKLILSDLPEEWPFAYACIVRGLKFDDNVIKKIIDIQEKLGMGHLRKRRKGGIGLYPLDKISFPISFVGRKPEEIKFQPLEFPKEINGRQILSQHPTGREYANICKDWDLFPVFIDNKNVVMSMPPIINSHNVGKVNENTRDVFIEATGTDSNALLSAINMIVSALIDMGGKAYSIECVQLNGDKVVVPDLSPSKQEFSLEYINKNLGLELDDKEIEELLGKMGIGVEKNGDSYIALIPAYRADILHEIDLVEEVAIAYGYENFKPEIPDISTIGEESKISVLKRKIGEVLTGLGLLEVSSFHLSTKEKQFKRIGIKEFKDKMIEVLDSKTENNILRTSLFGGIMNVFRENTNASYPQEIFEIGKVFKNGDEIEEEERLGIGLCSDKANFTQIKQILDYLMRMFDIEYEIREGEREGFIDGRVGEIFVDGQSIGFLGEVSPRVLKNNRLMMPVSALEISVDWMMEKNK